MSPQQEILQILFNNQLFADSDIKLAAMLGYGEKSRSTIRRIKNGEKLKESTINDMWDKLREYFFMSDEEITSTAESVAYGHNLLEELQAAYGIGNEWHDKAFAALVTEDYATMPQNFEKELSVSLSEMKLQNPSLYYGMIAFCYILCKNITPYTADGKKQQRKQLELLNDFLYTIFPANSRAKTAADKSISFELADENLTLVKLLYNLRIIFANYIDEEYFENYFREKGHLLNVGEASFWITPGDSFGKGSMLWYFSVIPTKSQLHGSYIAMKLHATSGAINSFELIESYNFLFLVANDKEETQILQVYDMPSGKVGYAGYGYDYDEKRLTFHFAEQTNNTFALPDTLQCIDIENAKEKDEKVWARIAKELLDSGDCQKILLQAVNTSAESEHEYLDEYEIVNVTIDRKNITITTLLGEVEKSYTMLTDNYTFLAKISPNEFVSVARSKNSGELFFTWNNIGQFIPMKEFHATD